MDQSKCSVVFLGGPEVSVVSCLWVDKSKCSVASLGGPEMGPTSLKENGYEE